MGNCVVSGSGVPAGCACASAVASASGGVVPDGVTSGRVESGVAGSGETCSAGPGSHRDPLCRVWSSSLTMLLDPRGPPQGVECGWESALRLLCGACVPAPLRRGYLHGDQPD